MRSFICYINRDICMSTYVYYRTFNRHHYLLMPCIYIGPWCIKTLKKKFVSLNIHFYPGIKKKLKTAVCQLRLLYIVIFRCRSFQKYFKIIWLSLLLTLIVPADGYSRTASCALKLISPFNHQVNSLPCQLLVPNVSSTKQSVFLHRHGLCDIFIINI